MKWIVAGIVLAVLFLLGTVLRYPIERRLLFYPTHRMDTNGLTPWVRNGSVIGYARLVPAPRNTWLMLPGNSGQASDRTYALPSFSPEDSVYILEYPGYGRRPGIPSKKSIDRAAKEAYDLLRETYLHTPVCVAAESIGSGPASYLCTLAPPPDKLVLIVPFDKLSLVAEDHAPTFLVHLLLVDNWNNVRALSHYRGPVEIYAARSDTIIPIRHAEALAASVPGSTLIIIDGGHNDWSEGEKVRIRNP